MTISAGIADELPFLRAEAEALMGDVFIAYSPNGTTRDQDGMKTLAYLSQGTTVGKLQGRGGAGQSDTVSRTENVGGVERPVITAGLHIPVSAPEPTGGARGVGWEYVLTEAGALTPPELVGSRWLVVDSPAKSLMTARRLDVVRLP